MMNSITRGLNIVAKIENIFFKIATMFKLLVILFITVKKLCDKDHLHSMLQLSYELYVLSFDSS